MIWLTYSLAILPIVLISFLFINKLKKKNPTWLTLAFLMGCLATIPAYFYEKLEFYVVDLSSSIFLNEFIIAFLLVGLGEEFVKFGVLLLVNRLNNELNSIVACIIYSVIIAMGFAFVENIFYAYLYDFSTVAVRFFTAVPAHAVFGIITGYFLGVSKLDEKNRTSLLCRGFAFVVLLHGLYDWFILQNYAEAARSGALVVLCFGIYYSYLLISLALDLHKASPSELPVLLDNSLQDEKDLPGGLEVEKADT